MFSDERNSRIDHYDTLDLESLLALERESPRDVDLLVATGQHYLKRHQPDRSYACYSRALAIDPDDGWTHLFMGNLCFALSCWDEAVRHFQRAIELLPDVACPHWCLAEAYERQGYWLRTTEQFQRAVQIDPTDATARQKLETWIARRRSVAYHT